MPDKPVIILHGYSDDAWSFDPLATFLRGKGFSTQSIYLGNYITLEDKITIADLAEAFESELASLVSREAKSFDLIVHSTGALVAREWLTRFYLELNKPCPLDHFLMLAPANFGSPLGAVGKTMLGRIVKGWSSDFQSGTQVLSALEMGSPYSRALAQRDVLVDNSYYRPEVCKTAVLVGSHPYAEGLRKLVDKNGGDGTVYVCTANLNTSYVRVRMGPANQQTPNVESSREKQDIAFGVFPDRTHSTITQPQTGDGNLGDMIVRFLQIDSVDNYDAFRSDCATLTATTLPENPSTDYYHSYMNLAPRAVDNLGYPIGDYFLEFYEKPASADDKTIDDLMVKVHSEIIEDVHNYSGDASYRSLIFDLTDLNRLLIAEQKQLMFSLSAAPLSTLIGYSCDQRNQVGAFPLNPQTKLFWRPSQTLLVDAVVERRQGSNDKKAFEIKKAPLPPKS